MSVSPSVVRGVHRRLALPPPAARSSLAVWRELADADEDLAWALFLVTRRVRAVADGSAPARWTRADDVRAAAAGAPEIAADLLLLGARQLSLAGARRGRVAGACNRLAAWAAEQGFGEVAVQLAEAAVALQPRHPRWNYEAARLNKQFGHLPRAEVLYGRAICLARPGRHWWVYVRAHLGLGEIHKWLGDQSRAAAHYMTAARGARDRLGEKWLAAMIEQDLFALAVENGDLPAAYGHARRAYEWMPKHHQNVPALAHDFAYMLVKAHRNRQAMMLLDQLVKKRLGSASMVLIWSTYARAAALLGDATRYRRAEEEIEALAPRFQKHSSAAHVNLAFGSYALGYADEAERHAVRSLALANAADDQFVKDEAEGLLSAIRTRTPDESSDACDLPEHVHGLADLLIERLRAWRGPTWRRKRQFGRVQPSLSRASNQQS